MSPDEIIAQLTRVQHQIPRDALHAADQHRAELTPRLLASLAEAGDRPETLENDPGIQLPFYAMYLLAAWREPQAHPLLLRFLRLPGEQALDLSGDIVTQDINRMLAQTCAGDPQHIITLAQDPAANPWVRTAAVRALALLTAWGEAPREAVLLHFRALIAAASPPDEHEDNEAVLTGIVCSALDLQLVEMRDELLALFDRGWIGDTMVGRDEFAQELGQHAPRNVPTPIVEVADEISSWGCFEEEQDPEDLLPAPAAVPSDSPGNAEPVVWAAPKPFRAPPKIGRNDPCPCGSGRKYKKCCGR